MKNKIKDYIELIFADAPACRRTEEMKEEMYANVCDRYEDLIKEGKSESAAYNISIAGIGDISDLIDSIKREQGTDLHNPYEGFEGAKAQQVFTAEEKEEIAKYRTRSAIMQSVAIALYILCWVPLVIITSITSFMGGNDEISGIVGLVVMMVMIAVATALLIFKSSIKPLCLKGIDDDEDEEKKKKEKKRKNPLLNAVTSALWGVTVIGYLLIGFFLGLWHPGWIVFIIAAAVENIIEAIFEIAGKKYI